MHEDSHPSLSINKTKDVWMCGPCGASGNAWKLAAFLAKADPGDKGAVTHWLKARGLMNGNGNRHHPPTPPNRWKSHPIKEWYQYTDAGGVELYRTGRVEFQNEKGKQKEFPVWAHGHWGLNGTKPVLYRLPKLAAAAHVFIVEGEKDVHTLEAAGLTATTNPMGAGNWRDEYSQSFARHQLVTVLPDNDDRGRAHAVHAAKSLTGKVASVKVLELPGLPDRGDVTDWFAGKDASEAAEELSILADRAGEFSPKTDGSNELQAESSQELEQLDEARYRLTRPSIGVALEIDRLRREHNELIGELRVYCSLPGSITFDGALSIADFNLSSARARNDRGKLLASRAKTSELGDSDCLRILPARLEC